MKNINKIKISSDISIKQALKVINDGMNKIAIVTDEEGKLIGTLTDGDIRRGFLKGLNIDNSIESIIFRNPIVAKKGDSKDKLLKIALSKKIYQIPIVDKNKKVLGIHLLDQLFRPKLKTNKVIIMAGGEGIRLRPLTNNIPKPMLKVGDKPILQKILEKFKDSGYKNFIITVNYKSEIIKGFFKNGKKFGVNIEYINEKVKMGTAGALSLIKVRPKDPFFVINADLLTNLDFDKMLDFHSKCNATATMCVVEKNIESPYGEVKLDNENIISIEEKPLHKIFINGGVYILDPICLDLVPKNFFDMPSLFTKLISERYKAISFPWKESWLDIGAIEEYKKIYKKDI